MNKSTFSQLFPFILGSVLLIPEGIIAIVTGSFTSATPEAASATVLGYWARVCGSIFLGSGILIFLAGVSKYKSIQRQRKSA